jgi:drug/metabolite transporter (DMT)-like permease
MDYLQLLLYSTAVSLFILFALLLAQKKIHLLKTYSGKQYIRSFLMGILNPFLYYIVLFKAYSLLPAQQAQPLNYTWPIMVVVLSLPLLHQRINVLNILAVMISFCGVIVIATQGNIQNLNIQNGGGVVLALGSSFIWALFWILNLWDKRDNVAKLFLNFGFGFIFILLVAPLLSSPLSFSVYGFAGIAYIGVFEMGVSFVIWMKALSLSHTTAQVSNLIYLSPFVSLVFIHFFVGEIIRFSTVIGLGIIVLGIALQHCASQRYILP